ncbi:MAG: hypothetical protein K8W52_42925 [Deltaproteobacteria bacterium]|nr:hypothetical protein [Deltaproteobacteria bacterium]
MMLPGKLRIGATRALFSTAVATAIAGLCACGGGGQAGSDGGVLPPTLEVLTPPGDSIGLAPGDTVTLRVRLSRGDGTPIADAPVSFGLDGGADGTGGATLAAATAATDGGGVAQVDLTAGPVRVDFQVTADAPDAPRALFYVSVSADGFADLAVMPRYRGVRAMPEIQRIELRAYRGLIDCATISGDAPPPSPMAPRSLAGFGGAVVWPGLPAGEPYTIAAWADHAVSGKAVAIGCAGVPGAQVPIGRLELALGVDDRPLALPAAVVTSHLDLSIAAGIESLAGIDRPWRTLACPSGAGQLALDWLIDAQSADGALDGTVAYPMGTAATLTARRGALGADGCRAAIQGGEPSLDAIAEAAIARGPFPGAVARAALEVQRRGLFGDVAIGSTLAPLAAGSAHHHLVAATIGGEDVALTTSARPVIDADLAVAQIGTDLALGTHAFTGRLGAAIGDGFARGPLHDAGLMVAGSLGAALVDAARDGNLTGCAALDHDVCAGAGLADGCVALACPATAAALDGALTAWWRQLDGDGLDLALAGHASAMDANGDLVLDAIGDGRWDVTLTLADGSSAATTGTWSSAIAPP